LYERDLFERKLRELRLTDEFTRCTIARLDESFTIGDLRRHLREELKQPADRKRKGSGGVQQAIRILAESNYEVQFKPKKELSERIYSELPTQSNGSKMRGRLFSER